MPASTIGEHICRFCNPVKIISGMKALEHLPVELGCHDAVRPLVVVHLKKGLRGRLRRLVGAFRDSGMTLVVYDRLLPAADLEEIKTLAGHYHEAGCDALLVMGQGRLLHQVKALRHFIQTHAFSETQVRSPNRVSTDEAPSLSSGEDRPHLDPPEPSARIPLFWLPTGPGRGDELGGRFEMDGQSLTHPGLRPQLACIDKRLLDPSGYHRHDGDGLLESVLIALVNAVEVCLLEGHNPFAVAYAEAAIKTVVETLTPEGLEASKTDILLALTNAAVWADCARDMQPPGLAQRLGHALAARVDWGAGVLMALCLPEVVDQALVGEARLTAQLLHHLGGAELYSLTEPKLLRPKCVNLLREGWQTLCENWPGALPSGLKETGIAPEALKEVAEAVDPANPQTALTILERSWTLIPALQLWALPPSSKNPADRQNPTPPVPRADRGSQDATAELL